MVKDHIIGNRLYKEELMCLIFIAYPYSVEIE